jgi:hypothetical protein
MAYLITLYEPNKAMIDEAAGSGLYHSPDGNAYPKIQILSIENLLKGHQPSQPKDLLSGAATFKKSKPKLSDTSRKASLF